MDILEATRIGDIEKVKLLLTDINITDEYGHTLLHLASHSGHTHIVKFLLYEYVSTETININATNEYGNTPLHFASYRGYSEVVDILLNAGADFKAINKYGSIPLDLADNTIVREILVSADKKDVLWDIWILESYVYNSYLQWLPREMTEDVLDL